MDGMLLPILIAVAVMLAVFGIIQVIRAGSESGEKRRLQNRLGAELKAGGSGNLQRSITMDQHEATGVSGALTRISLLNSLHRHLIQAYPDMALAKFLAIAFGAGFGTFVVFAALAGSAVIGAIAAAIGFYVPFLLLSNKRSKRQRQIANQIPEALDFLSRILRAGHSLSTGIQMMGEELPQPLAGEFRRCYDQHSLGMALEDAMKEMASRIDSTDFAFFVTAVLIQRQTGGDLSEVLNNISGMIRQRIRLQNHVKAKTAEGRFTGYILVAFPAVMFVISYVLNPQYAGVLLHTSTGLWLLGTAFGLQMLGLWAIRKITTVRV